MFCAYKPFIQSTLRQFTRTIATSVNKKLSLPRQENWKTLYASARRVKRNSLADPAYADYFVKHFLGGEANLKNKRILEYMPGAGLLTKSILRHNAKGVIVLEYEPTFLRVNTELAQEYPNEHMTVLPYHSNLGFSAWYSNTGVFSQIEKRDWETLHPDLLITGMLNMGKFQILSRFFNNILGRQHMFSYGRVEAIMICDEKTIEMAQTHLGHKDFRPLSLWAMGSANIEVLDHNVPSDIFCCKITPLVKPLLLASPEVIHYVLTMLYTRKRQPLAVAIRTLAPDAIELLDNFNGDPNTLVYQLSVEQINQITMRFDHWSKRPFILNETLALN
ncbi:S-adenosyl-L-methionine-dependent methyltransferase [Syncephalis fuscata]|nr:S-adenosyl-L-methionine-dependent methyltransferase [Syncephalis fuscata]